MYKVSFKSSVPNMATMRNLRFYPTNVTQTEYVLKKKAEFLDKNKQNDNSNFTSYEGLEISVIRKAGSVRFAWNLL